MVKKAMNIIRFEPVEIVSKIIFAMEGRSLQSLTVCSFHLVPVNDPEGPVVTEIRLPDIYLS